MLAFADSIPLKNITLTAKEVKADCRSREVELRLEEVELLPKAGIRTVTFMHSLRIGTSPNKWLKHSQINQRLMLEERHG